MRGRKKQEPSPQPEDSESEPSIPPPYTGEGNISRGDIQSNDGDEPEAWDAALVGRDRDEDEDDDEEEADEEEEFDDYEEVEQQKAQSFDQRGQLGDKPEQPIKRDLPRITTEWLAYEDVKEEMDSRKKFNPDIMPIDAFLKKQQVGQGESVWVGAKVEIVHGNRLGDWTVCSMPCC